MTINDEIKGAVLAAMQPAEELGGPEGLDYIDLMQEIAQEALERAQNARELLASERKQLTKEEERALRYRNYMLSIEPVLAWCREHINGNASAHDTGGGCMAISFPRGNGTDGGYWLITVLDDAEIPKTITEPVAVGCYDDGGEHWVMFKCADLAAAAVLISSYCAAS